jgi:hypothetical protein
MHYCNDFLDGDVIITMKQYILFSQHLLFPTNSAEHVLLWGSSPLHLTMVVSVWCLGGCGLCGLIYTLVSKS